MIDRSGEAKHLHFETKRHVGFLVIDRPRNRNALSLSMLRDVRDIVTNVATNGALRALVIASASPSIFCAGADVKEYVAHAGDLEWGIASKTAVEAAAAAIAECRLPTVAVVDGACIGAGMSLLVACDIRLAGPSARFAIPSTRLGFVYPYADTRRLVRSIGSHRALYLLLTGRTIEGAEALQFGLVDERYPDAASLADALEKLLDHFRSSTVATTGTKQYVDAAVRGTDETEELVAIYRSALQNAAETAAGTQ